MIGLSFVGPRRRNIWICDEELREIKIPVGGLHAMPAMNKKMLSPGSALTRNASPSAKQRHRQRVSRLDRSESSLSRQQPEIRHSNDPYHQGEYPVASALHGERCS
jgi:hypothetical protein